MKQRNVDGVLFRGPDDQIYFIPNEALAPFRVYDHERERVEPLLASRPARAEAPKTTRRLRHAVQRTISISVPEADEASAVGLAIIGYLEGQS